MVVERLGDLDEIAVVGADGPGKLNEREVALADSLVVGLERGAEGRDDLHERVVVSFAVELGQRDGEDDGGDADFVFHWWCLVGGGKLVHCGRIEISALDAVNNFLNCIFGDGVHIGG